VRERGRIGEWSRIRRLVRSGGSRTKHGLPGTPYRYGTVPYLWAHCLHQWSIQYMVTRLSCFTAGAPYSLSRYSVLCIEYVPMSKDSLQTFFAPGISLFILRDLYVQLPCNHQLIPTDPHSTVHCDPPAYLPGKIPQQTM
jgi:hypothetical protein